jgi:hypothetical protein
MSNICFRKEHTLPLAGKITLPKLHVSINYHQKLRKVQWIVFPNLRTPTRTSPGMGDGLPGETGVRVGTLNLPLHFR